MQNSRGRLILLLSFAALVLLGAAAFTGRPSPSSWTTPWQTIAPGLSWGAFRRGPVRVTVVRGERARWRLQVCDARKVSREGGTAAQICPRTGAAINASFFAADRSPIGWVVSGGKEVSPPYRGRTGYGVWQLLLVKQGQVTFAPLRGAPPEGVEEAIQIVPRLLREGKIQPLKQTPAAPRAALGLDAKGHVFLAVAEGDLTLQEWARCLRDELGCRDALGLDGGPSAQLSVRGASTINRGSPTPVPILLQLVPSEERS